jgi:type II secretory pathway pseudopilin PulG
MEQLRRYNNHGQLLVELLVALAVASILIPAVMAGFIASRQGVAQARQRLEATALAREASDAVLIVRDAQWSNVATTGTYHPVITGDTWTLASGSAVVNGYTESLVISDVSRDLTGVIVTTGGTVDPSTKKVTVTVSWGLPIVSSVIESFYITRLTNISWIQTTQADFDGGTKNGVITTDTWDGEVTLGAGGKGDWCGPNLSIAAVNLPKSGVANAVSAIPNQVFAGTGDNASGVSYATVKIDDSDPPHATISGTFDGFKTNGIFGEQNYAYLATDNNFKEIEIINLTTNPYSEAGYFDAPGNGNGNSVSASGNVGYMTSGNIFYTFDLSSKTGSRLKLGSVSLDGTGVKIVIVGSYAYVAISSATTQMDIVDISDSANPNLVAKAHLNTGAGTDVFVNSTGTRTYVSSVYAAGKPEFSIVNTSTKSGTLVSTGSYTTDGMSPKALTIVPGNKAVIVGTGGSQQYVVLDITDETNPIHCTSHGRSGGLAIPTGVQGVASVIEADGDTFSYIITGDAAAELKMIQGGPGGAYATNGIFESSTLAATNSAVFNRFIPNGFVLPNTTIQYQVAGANMVNGSCNGVSFTYVGPDGTGNTKFSTGSAIPMSPGPGFKNPAQCFRYKAFLATTDTFSEPIMTDMTVNYSP